MRLRKESEQQTDLTYSQVNKKVQANTMADEDQISDVDEMLEADQETDVDAASSVLSQSLRSTHSYNGGDSSRYYRYVLIYLLRPFLFSLNFICFEC